MNAFAAIEKRAVSKFDSATKKACTPASFLEFVAHRFREAQKPEQQQPSGWLSGGSGPITTESQPVGFFVNTTNQMATKKQETVAVHISAPKIETLAVRIVGTAPYVQVRFSEKAINAMSEKMMAGSQATKKKAREARDFDEDFRQAMHISDEGWHGIPASAFRAGMIDACRLVGFKMTQAKMSVFVEADGFDKIDAVPLIKIKGKPEPSKMHVRNATGVCDLRVRAKFWPWSAVVRISYDAGQFSASDAMNLLHRVGAQVGIGEGRPFSKNSAGMGWGTFKLAD
jgi:hypothetical protein